MRYWIDTSHVRARTSAPVFLVMGGEGASGPAGGQQSELAAAHGAYLFSIEHRYYGKSMPTPTLTTADLGVLSAEQALADAAYFARAMARAHNFTTSNRWITFGGSYSGELAAWARLKYPHIFFAAVSSSAPVTAIVDYDEYDGIVADALARELVGGSAGCRNAVKQAFATLEGHMDNDRPSLRGMFDTCGEVIEDGDCYLLHDFISDDFMGLVQYNDDGDNIAVNIRSRCKQMLNVTLGRTPFDRLVFITAERRRQWGNCLYDQDLSGITDSISFVDHLRGYADPSNPGRSFPYQQCIDGVGHVQTCKPSKGCIFSPKYATRGYFQRICAEAFNVTPSMTDAAVDFNSVLYGDNKPGGSRIVFINGDIDPFHAGGVTTNSSELLSRDIVALMVKGGSHCQDMGASSEEDSPSMKSVKRGKAAIVARWLSM